jgi:hypothetical protein
VNHQHFQVGEIAVVNCPGCDTHGIDATVIGPLEKWRLWDGEIGEGTPRVADCYPVVVAGEILGAEPHELRKKRPPRDDLKVVRWADVPHFDPTGKVPA